jgi:hypothetical protein
MAAVIGFCREVVVSFAKEPRPKRSEGLTAPGTSSLVISRAFYWLQMPQPKRSEPLSFLGISPLVISPVSWRPWLQKLIEHRYELSFPFADLSASGTRLWVPSCQ